MYEIITTSQFRRDIKRCKRQNKNMLKFKEINELLIAGIKPPLKNQDHFLSGQWSGFRECHIEPDWLLIYKINGHEKVIEYVRTGSHSDLFR